MYDQDHQTYPDIYIPRVFKRAKESLPPIPNPPKPPEDFTLSKPEKYPGCIVVLGILISLISLFFSVELSVAVGVLSVATLLLFRFTYQQRLEEFKKGLKENEIQKVKYLKKQENHLAEIDKIRSPERVKNHQIETLLNATKNTQPPRVKNPSVKMGVSESKFLAYLEKYFPGNIEIRIGLEIPNYDYPYTPDYCYIDEDFHMDIEIDEPYVWNTKAPYHYLGNAKEQNRNDFFLNRNWVIIRFAEEQVCRYPDSCCKEIAKVLEELFGKPISSNLKKIEDLEKVDRWSYDEAEEMADRDYRSSYLKP
jgi:hypothetical protein